MKITLQDLTFKTYSPSFLKLDEVHLQPGCECDVTFLGDQWYLFLSENGHVRTQCFLTRDEAIKTIRDAYGET